MVSGDIWCVDELTLTGFAAFLERVVFAGSSSMWRPTCDRVVRAGCVAGGTSFSSAFFERVAGGMEINGGNNREQQEFNL